MSGWLNKMIETERGSFEVFVKGEGLPICVTHHYSEFNRTGDYFADTFTQDHRVYLVNLKEAGKSDGISSPHDLSMFDAVYDLEAIREALGFSQWTYAGHSTGGMIGLLYGIHFSASLQALIIVGSAARRYADSSPDCIYHADHPDFQHMQQLIEALKRSDLSSEERMELSKERTKLSLFRPEKYEQYFSEDIHKKLSAVRMNFFIREVMIFDVTRQLESIQVPVLLVCGRHDVQCPVTFTEEMHELIPVSKLYLFEKSNHYPFIEERNAFVLAVESFINCIEISD